MWVLSRPVTVYLGQWLYLCSKKADWRFQLLLILRDLNSNLQCMAYLNRKVYEDEATKLVYFALCIKAAFISVYLLQILANWTNFLNLIFVSPENVRQIVVFWGDQCHEIKWVRLRIINEVMIYFSLTLTFILYVGVIVCSFEIFCRCIL